MKIKTYQLKISERTTIPITIDRIGSKHKVPYLNQYGNLCWDSYTEAEWKAYGKRLVTEFNTSFLQCKIK